jgi:hypothetical protein
MISDGTLTLGGCAARLDTGTSTINPRSRMTTTLRTAAHSSAWPNPESAKVGFADLGANQRAARGSVKGSPAGPAVGGPVGVPLTGSERSAISPMAQSPSLSMNPIGVPPPVSCESWRDSRRNVRYLAQTIWSTVCSACIDAFDVTPRHACRPAQKDFRSMLRRTGASRRDEPSADDEPR